MGLETVPSPPTRRFTGHLLDLLEPSYHRKLHQWAKEYGNVYKINVLGIEGLVVCCPKIISQLLGQERGTPGLPKLSAYHELDMVRVPHRPCILQNLIRKPVKLRGWRTMAMTSFFGLSTEFKFSVTSMPCPITLCCFSYGATRKTFIPYSLPHAATVFGRLSARPWRSLSVRHVLGTTNLPT